MEDLIQSDVILKAMLENDWVEEWTAKDFQSGYYFVGYEATARMSELARKYPTLIKVGRDGRFRTLSIYWGNKDAVNYHKKRLGIDR